MENNGNIDIESIQEDTLGPSMNGNIEIEEIHPISDNMATYSITPQYTGTSNSNPGWVSNFFQNRELSKIKKNQRFDRRVSNLIALLPLRPVQIEILKKRFVQDIIYYDAKKKSEKKWYNTLSMITTIGSILVPALLSIQPNPMNDGDRDTQYNTGLYWLTWGLSLMVTMSNGIIRMYDLDKSLYKHNILIDKLEQEGWKYFELSGLYGEFQNHSDGFVHFCNEIERIKSKYTKQTSHSFDLDEIPS